MDRLGRVVERVHVDAVAICFVCDEGRVAGTQAEEACSSLSVYCIRNRGLRLRFTM